PQTAGWSGHDGHHHFLYGCRARRLRDWSRAESSPHGPSISDVSRWGGPPHDGGQSSDGTCSLGRSWSRHRCTERVAGAPRRGGPGYGPGPAFRCVGAGGWGRSLCLLRRASSPGIMDPRAVTDEGERIAQILVVAWIRLFRDVLSGGGGMCDFPIETAWNSNFLCHGRWRIRDRHDGAVLLLSRVSPACRRTTGTDDVECLAPVSLCHGNSRQVNGCRGFNAGWFWLEGLTECSKSPPASFSHRLDPQRTPEGTPRPFTRCGLAGQPF